MHMTVIVNIRVNHGHGQSPQGNRTIAYDNCCVSKFDRYNTDISLVNAPHPVIVDVVDNSTGSASPAALTYNKLVRHTMLLGALLTLSLGTVTVTMTFGQVRAHSA